LCISQGADTAWRRGEETRRWCEESWSRRIVHIFRMIKINKVPHCSVYWGVIVYVIMNVSDKRWKGEGASRPGWTPQAHYTQTIAITQDPVAFQIIDFTTFDCVQSNPCMQQHQWMMEKSC
jgi:hypothetical protein